MRIWESESKGALHSPKNGDKKKVFAAASLLLTEVTWVGALMSIAKHHCNTTSHTHKALIVALLLGSAAATAAVIHKSPRITLLHLVALYATHVSILCLVVAGPMRADNERIIAEMSSGSRSHCAALSEEMPV